MLEGVDSTLPEIGHDLAGRNTCLLPALGSADYAVREPFGPAAGSSMVRSG